MVVTVLMWLADAAGHEDEYEVTADVTTYCGRIVIGEPEFSAPGGRIATSRLWRDPQEGGVLDDGWSELAEQAIADEWFRPRDDERDPDDFADPWEDDDA